MKRIASFIQSLRAPLYFNVQFDLTNACNLRCSHCYHPHHNNAGSLTLDEWEQAISKVQKFARQIGATPKYTICGGEPTLSPHFGHVMKKLREETPSCHIFVLTNGTLLDRPVPSVSGKQGSTTPLEIIKHYGNAVQVSLDGPTPESHDSIRGRGNFAKAIRGATLLLDQGTDVSFQSVLSTKAVSEILDFFALAKNTGVNAMNFIRIVEQGQAMSYLGQQSEHLYGHDLRSAMESILRHSHESGIYTDTFGPLWALIDPALGSGNRLGFYEVIVDYQGHLKVSSRTSPRIGHILRDDLWALFQSNPDLVALRKGNIRGCETCPLFKNRKCSGDRNIAFAATGSFLGPDVGCWKWIEENDSQIKTHPGYITSNNCGSTPHVA